MKRIEYLIIALFALALSSCSSSDDKSAPEKYIDIVGQWQETAYKSDGIFYAITEPDMTYTFSSDGKFTEKSKLYNSEGSYTFDGISTIKVKKPRGWDLTIIVEKTDKKDELTFNIYPKAGTKETIRVKKIR